MSPADHPGGPPPEVPEEFAEAYREAYERALAAADARARETRAYVEGDLDVHPAPTKPKQVKSKAVKSEPVQSEPVQSEPVPSEHVQSARVPDATRVLPSVPPVDTPAPETQPAVQGVEEGGTGPLERLFHEPGEEPEPVVEPSYDETVLGHAPAGLIGTAPGGRLRDERWFVPALLGGLALLLVLGAYGVGRIFSDNVDETAATAGPATHGPSRQPSASASSSPTSKPTPKPKKATGAYHGAVTPVSIGRATARCVAAPGVDSAGRRVSYRPGNMVDGDDSTAWRCDGTAVGQQLVFTLPGSIQIGQVGLIPGYAKTDPRSGADRYAQNNRITKVRWILGDGTEVTQSMSGSPKDRSLRTMRVPLTRTGSVTLQILAIAKGPRNTTMISTVALGAGNG